MIGLRLHNYEVVSLLGTGGMGQIYRARHTYMGRRAAVKFLRPELIEDPTVVARFLDESRATNSIGHPSIIDIIDVGLLSDGRMPYLLMEYLNGESLAARLARSRPLPIHEAVEIARQTASALGAAHARQIVHRDRDKRKACMKGLHRVSGARSTSSLLAAAAVGGSLAGCAGRDARAITTLHLRRVLRRP